MVNLLFVGKIFFTLYIADKVQNIDRGRYRFYTGAAFLIQDILQRLVGKFCSIETSAKKNAENIPI